MTKSAPAAPVQLSPASVASVVPALDTTKSSVLNIDPNKLLIVGIDFGDSTTPGYDSRVKLPLDEQLVTSICKYGVVIPVEARVDGEDAAGEPRYLVNAGRRRVMHARVANIRLVAAGLAPIKVKTIIVRGDELALMARNRVSNAYAVKDDPITEAGHMSELIGKGASEDDVALAFGVKVVTVKDRLKLLNLAPEAQAKVVAKEMTTNGALELVNAGLSMAEQVQAMVQAREAGGGKLSTKAVANAAKAAQAAKSGTAAKAKKTPSERLVDAASVFTPLTNKLGKGDKLRPEDMETALRRLYERLFSQKWETAIKAVAAQAAAQAEEDDGKAA